MVHVTRDLFLERANRDELQRQKAVSPMKGQRRDVQIEGTALAKALRSEEVESMRGTAQRLVWPAHRRRGGQWHEINPHIS